MKKIKKKGIIIIFITLQNSKNEVIYLSDIKEIEDVIFDFEKEGEKTKDANIIAYLTIDSINLIEAPIAEGTSDDILNQYIGHFEETAYINGNIALCSHNRGYEKNYFENLKNVKIGDVVIYKTKNKQYKYEVSSIDKILETNLKVLEESDNAILTLITCVENQPKYRYCIIAEKIE